MKANVTTSNVVVAGAVDQTQKSLIDLLADCPVLPIPSEANDGNRVFVSEAMLKVLKETLPVYTPGVGAHENHAPLKPLGAVDVLPYSLKHLFDIAGVRSIEIGARPVVERFDASSLNMLKRNSGP